MISITEKFDSLKLDRIKRMLQVQQHTSKVFYEILIDGFCIVNKTENLDLFDSYEDLIDDNTKSLEIVTYPAERAKATKKFSFEFQDKFIEKIPEKTLGAVEVENIIEKRLAYEREKWEAQSIRNKLADAEEKLEQAEEYIERLHEGIDQLKEKNSNNDNLFNIISIVREYAPHFIGKGKPEQVAIAGTPEVATSTEGSASFKRKEEKEFSGLGISEADQKKLELLQQREKAFTAEELVKIDVIIDELAEQKEAIDVIVDSFNQAKNATNTNHKNDTL